LVTFPPCILFFEHIYKLRSDINAMSNDMTIENTVLSQQNQAIPPPLQIVTANRAEQAVIPPVPLKEEEVESGRIMEIAAPPVVPVPSDESRVSENKAIENMHSTVAIINDPVPSPNDPDSADFDPLSYRMSAAGQLLEPKEEWYRRPKVTIDSNGEMVFRPLRMQCTHCDAAFCKTHSLYAHIRSHQRHSECPQCGKVLTCMATFVYHVRTHSMEKPYFCPCDGCDFQNAVKYNLKVHLASIRHGGKSNLAKYAKVLDLDVCDKSMRKRKDNSVHELGSRRSKKRRKLNNGSSSRSRSRPSRRDEEIYGEPLNYHSMNPMDPMMANNAMYGGYYSQADYDQFAAQLLFSLSSYQNATAGIQGQSVYDPNAMQMEWAQNLNALNMTNPMDAAAVNPQPQLMLDQNGNVVSMDGMNAMKDEQMALGVMNGVNPMGAVPEYMALKPEQIYDPNYAYYAYANQAAGGAPLSVNVDLAAHPTGKQLTSDDSAKISAGTLSNATPKEVQPPNAVQSEMATKDHVPQPAVQQDANPMLPPKQEPQSGAIADAEALYANYEMMQQQQQHQAMMMQQDPTAMMMQQHPQFEQQALAAQYMMAPAYYPASNGAYGQMMYGDPNMMSSAQALQQMQQQMQAIQDQEEEKAIDVPPLPTEMQGLEIVAPDRERTG